MRWIVSFPCWGIEHSYRAQRGPLRSVLAALRHAGLRRDEATIMINTDDWRRFADFRDRCEWPVELWEVTAEEGAQKYQLFGDCHRHAIDVASPGDRVAFLCADMTISRESFAFAAEAFDGGKRVVVGAASPTMGDAPVDAGSRALLGWSFENLAPMAKDLFWGEGRGAFPWCVYFRHAKGIDFHGFHIHPFACVKREGLTFKGSTVDYDLCAQFPEGAVRVIRSPDEMSMVARAASDGTRPRTLRVGALSATLWAASMGKHALERHLWQFRQQITLQGEPGPSQPHADRVDRMIRAMWRERDKRNVRALYGAHHALQAALREAA